MNSAILTALTSHLWQSTLIALAAGGLTVLLRKNGARVRYCLWLAASVKFLVPFTLLTAAGALIPWHPASVNGVGPSLSAPITVLGTGASTTDGNGIGLAMAALGELWLLGAIAVTARSCKQWMQIRRALRESTPTSVAFVIPVRSSAVQLEPAVVGILRPVLLIPKGIEQRLTPEQVSAVLAHERCHVAWRDNLAAALHMLVEALFWFHPLIWWLGRRLVEEREQACDEQVLADGHLPESYAEGILRVCEHYLESSLACAVGVSGANLRQRIEAIMGNRLIERVNGIQKLVMTAAASAALAVPLAVGVLSVPRAHAQAQNTAEPAVSTKLIQPQFKNADITSVADAVSAATGKNFIIDPRLHAQVTMISSMPLSPQAFYEAFQHVLDAYGFKAAGESDGAIKIVPKDNAPERSGSKPSEQPSTASDEFVTGVVNIKNVNAAQLILVVAPMVSREGHLSVYPSSNILYIFDRASNVNRLIPKIRSLDEAGHLPPT